MAVTEKFVRTLIQRGYEPYIKSHWMSGKHFGVTIAFRNNPTQYSCSIEKANELIKG